jgi:hypothetical protein
MAADVQCHPRPQAAAWLPTGGRDQGPLILIAEDGEVSLEVVKALLANRGLRTEVTPNG